MPKYLAINYLLKVVDATRALYDRMLLPSPHHLEYVNTYAHREQFIPQIKCPSITEKDDILFMEELQVLISRSLIIRHQLEMFDEDNSDISCSSDVLFDELINEVLSRDESTSTTDVMEEFLPHPLHHSHPSLTNDTEELIEFMESPESPPFMSFLVQDIPLACVLSQRLGPKPVSDPFLNHDGHLISHDAIFRHDQPVSSRTPDVIVGYTEIFTSYNDQKKEKQEMKFELPVSPMNGGLRLSGSYSEMMPIIEELDKEDIGAEAMEEAQSLDLGIGSTALSLCHIDEGSNNGVTASIVDLNNIGFNDSGVDSLMFESPHVDGVSSWSVTEDISKLELYPTTPEKDLIELLTASEQLALKKKLISQDSSFDNVANLKFQYPNVPDLCDCILMDTIVSDMIDVTKPSLESIDGELEFNLTWDPIAFVINNMKLAYKGLLSSSFNEATTTYILHMSLTASEVFEMENVDHHYIYGEDSLIQLPSINMSTDTSTSECDVVTRRLSSDTPVPRPSSTHHTTRRPVNGGGLEGLEGFMMMRSSMVATAAARNKHTSSTIQSNEGSTAEVIQLTEKLPLLQVVKPSSKWIPLSECYVGLLSIIADHCRPCLQSLDKYWSKNIGKDSSIDTWNGCIEFLLKDKRINSKSYENMEPGSIGYRSLLFLHVVAKVTRAIVHGSYCIGISLLTEATIHYEKQLSDEISVVRGSLNSYASVVTQADLIHPKLSKILEMMNNLDENEKVIILVNSIGISNEILKALQTLSNFEACECKFSKSEKREEIIRVIESKLRLYQCVIMPVGVVAVLMNTISNIHVSLMVEYCDDVPCGSTVNSSTCKEYIRLESTITNFTDNSNDLNDDECYLLVSTQIVNNSNLLGILESKYCFSLIEADFSDSTCADNRNKYFLADIVIDVQSCVIIRPLRLLSSQDGMRSLINTVFLLSERYSYCWIMLCSTENMYSFEGDIPINLGYLHASLAHLSSNNFIVQVTCCFGYHELAERIHLVFESRKPPSDQMLLPLEVKEALSFKPLRFLLSLQYFNPLSAICLLKKKSLRCLFRTPLSELKQLFPIINSASLERFYQLCFLGKTSYSNYIHPTRMDTVQMNQQPPDTIIIEDSDDEITDHHNMMSLHTHKRAASRDDIVTATTKRPRCTESSEWSSLPTINDESRHGRPSPLRAYDLGYESTSVQPSLLLPPLPKNDRDVIIFNR